MWNDGPTSYDAGDMTNNQRAQLHTVSRGLCSETGFIITSPDKALAQGSTVDNYGNPWVIQNNLLYTYDTSVSSNIVGLSAGGGGKLEAVACDKSNYIWLLYDTNKIAKFNTDRRLMFTTTLSSTPPSPTRYIDFIYEFSSTGYTDNVSILCQSLSGARSIKLDLSGNYITEVPVLSTDDKTYSKFDTDWSSKYISFKTSTGFDYLRKNVTLTGPKIEARVALTNIYNSTTTTAAFSSYSLSFPLSSMKYGWHHFAISLDAEKGTYEMYVDSNLVDSISLPGAKFSYTPIFDQPITVGSSPFYGGIPLSTHLKQPQHYLADGVKIKQFRLYNTPLKYDDIKAHYLTLANIGDARWDIPCGQRNFIDTIERVFKHRLPGRRSELFNINIKGLDYITDPVVKTDIQSRLENKINELAPTYTKLNRVRWGRDYSTALSGLSVDTNISIVTPTNAIESTTPVITTPTQTYEY